MKVIGSDEQVGRKKGEKVYKIHRHEQRTEADDFNSSNLFLLNNIFHCFLNPAIHEEVTLLLFWNVGSVLLIVASNDQFVGKI